MKLLHVLLPVVVLTGVALPAQAQLFGRKVYLNTMQVPELIVVARSDTDDRKRIAAIEQLRMQDIKANPEIVANLIEVMHSDPKYNVRMEAMHTLVQIRPKTPAVAQALQQTSMNDDNWLVRKKTGTQIWINNYYVSSAGNQAMSATAPTVTEPPLSSSGMPAAPVYVPSTLPAQPVYTVSPPASSSAGSVPRPLPPRPTTAPGYSTATPQRPAEIPSPLPGPPGSAQPPLPSAPPGPLPTLPVSPGVPSPSSADEPAVVPITPPR